MNSTAGTTKAVVDELRENGIKAGLLKLRVYRPFPAEEIARALAGVEAVAILDKAEGLSACGGPLFTDVTSGLYTNDINVHAVNYIYGIGGNAEAAELSGVNVKNVTLFAFCSIGMLAALSGILYSSRLSSATPQAGLGFETDAIASSYIGGTAVSGGVGKVTNAIIGTFVIMSLTNGMNLMSVDISYQYIVKGLFFIIAVAFDVRTRK